MKITFRFGDLEVPAQLNDSKTSKQIYAALPIQSKLSRWGDEIYFEVPVKVAAEDATFDLEVGDIAHWPEGSCLCLFFGKTPASVDAKPRPASPVIVVGSFSASAETLRKVRQGTSVEVRIGA